MHDENQPVIVKPNWGISEEDSGLVWSKLQFQLQLQQQQQHQQLNTMQAASRQQQRPSNMKMRGLHGPTAVWNQGPVLSTPSPGSGLHHLYRQEAAAAAYVLLDPWKQQLQQQQQQLQQQQQQRAAAAAAMETINLSLSGSGSDGYTRERQFLLEDNKTTSGSEPEPKQDPSSGSGTRVAARQDWEDDELLSLRPPNSSSSSSPEPYSQQQPQRNGTKRVRECPDETSPTKKPDCSPPGLQLVNVLLECAEALNREDRATTMSLLEQLRQGTSVSGDSMQRLAAHFSQALAMRVAATTRNPKLELGRDRHGGGGEEENEYLSAFTALYKVSPFFQIAHFTANQAILEATEGEQAVHIIDLDLMQGFQWPSLMQAMASRPGGPPAMLRLTGLGRRQESLRETGNRLASFAANCSVPFEFQGIAIGSSSKGWLEQVELRDGEAVAVNSVFKLHRLLGSGSAALDSFLSTVSSRVRPRVVTLVEQEASHNAPGFMARFMEALHYYAAVFDSLDASLPQRNEERLRIEAVMFARQITNIVACEGDQRVERHERMDFWASKMVAAGFRQLPLSSHAVRQARLLLQMCPCDGYRLVESPITPSVSDVGSISLAWQDDRLLLTASAWVCSAPPDSSSSNPCSPVSLSVSSSFDLLN